MGLSAIATLHTVLHTLMIAAAIGAALSFVTAMILKNPRAAAPGTLGLMLFCCCGFLWSADRFVVAKFSPSVTLAGPIVWVSKHTAKTRPGTR